MAIKVEVKEELRELKYPCLLKDIDTGNIFLAVNVSGMVTGTRLDTGLSYNIMDISNYLYVKGQITLSND